MVKSKNSLSMAKFKTPPAPSAPLPKAKFAKIDVNAQVNASTQNFRKVAKPKFAKL